MSLVILSVASGSLALIVAVRGTSHRMAISPKKLLRFISATRDLAARRIDQHVGSPAQDDIHRVARITLVTDFLADGEIHPLAGEGQKFQSRLLDLREDRHALQQLYFFVEVHRVLLGALTPMP